jgi:hypothetical protein
MYQINVQLAKVSETAHIPFGGLNMVFSNDFAQLSPAVGGNMFHCIQEQLVRY